MLVKYKTLILETETETYGKVKLELMKYNNPQIRNAFNLVTDKPITMKNSKGAVVCFQRVRNVTVKKIDSLKCIPKLKQKKSNLEIKELFLDDNANTSVEKFL